MSNNTQETLINNLDQLNYLPSSYESRLLSFLITAVTPVTAQDIVKELNIPDSKIYPALNNLEELNLIQINTNKRPKTYYFDNPEKLKSFLDFNFQQEQDQRSKLIDQINTISRQYWDPDELQLGNVARLMRGNEVGRELARLIKMAQNHLFILLSTKFNNHYDILQEYLIENITDDLRVDLALPHNDQTSKIIKQLEQQELGNIKLKTSKWKQNSYIIRDKQVMMNIYHSDEDVGLITNDELLVRNVTNCWSDPECCTNTNKIELELPHDFEFKTIQITD